MVKLQKDTTQQPQQVGAPGNLSSSFSNLFFISVLISILFVMISFLLFLKQKFLVPLPDTLRNIVYHGNRQHSYYILSYKCNIIEIFIYMYVLGFGIQRLDFSFSIYEIWMLSIKLSKDAPAWNFHQHLFAFALIYWSLCLRRCGVLLCIS